MRAVNFTLGKMATKPEGFGFGNAAKAFFKVFEFEPATKNGKPIDATMDMTIPFVYPGRDHAFNQELNKHKTVPQQQIYDRTEDESITKPELISMEGFQFSQRLMRTGKKGHVEISAVITAEGTVKDAHVLKVIPENYGLEEMALKMVSQWRYKPAMKDGSPVAVKQTITLNLGGIGGDAVFSGMERLLQQNPGMSENRIAASDLRDLGHKQYNLMFQEAQPSYQSVKRDTGYVKPEVTFQGAQPFPQKAKRLHKSGMVKMQLLIRKDGSYEIVKFLEVVPSDYGFEEAAKEYLKQSTRKPARLDGKPIDDYFELTIRFKLK